MVAGTYCLFVDTSGWIEVFSEKNASSSKEAKRILNAATKKHRPLITTNYVISEFIGRAGKACGFGREALFAAVARILQFDNLELVHIDKERHDDGIEFLLKRLDKDWSLVDATSFRLMTERRIKEALATDYDFEQAGFTKLL